MNSLVDVHFVNLRREVSSFDYTREAAMISLDEAIYEVGGRTSRMRFEVNQKRLARLAASSRSGNRRSGFRQAVILVSDYVAGLRCFVQSRLASEPGAIAC